ncbi:ArsR/SmtB family transcription factor [Pendulispora albinea]|uniref:Metalloregulator ArsR/SmtB family transcription factor n=1 Tax=Pendulispora albinea TaxID=2741071 RepID=A0ABZ2M4I4_9BACT
MVPATSELDRVFAALADPTRRAILARLATGEATVNELVAPFELSQPTISKHLKVLERAGLVSRGRDAQFRPVRLNAAPLEGAARWIGDYRRCWEESLDQLAVYVKELQQQQKEKTHESKRKRK